MTTNVNEQISNIELNKQAQAILKEIDDRISEGIMTSFDFYGANGSIGWASSWDDSWSSSDSC